MENTITISFSLELPNEINGMMAIYGASNFYSMSNPESKGIKELVTKIETHLTQMMGVNELSKMKAQMNAQFQEMQSKGVINQAQDICKNLDLKL